jgi:uncharacterized protein (TIGR02611 family)
VLFKTVQQAKRILKIAFGFALLLVGAIMVFSPGPGWVVIVLGLGLLAAEFVWARRLLENLRAQGLRLRTALLARDTARSV